MQQIAIMRSRLDIEASARQAEKKRLLQVILRLRVAPPHDRAVLGALPYVTHFSRPIRQIRRST